MARLRRRGDSYVVDYYKDGKRFRKSFECEQTATYVLNQLLMQELKKEMGIAVDGPIKEVKINEAIRQYYKTQSEGKVSVKNDRGYFERFYKFIHDDTGLSYLHEIERFHLESYQAIRKAQVAAASVNREFHTLKSFFNKCVEWGWLEESPAKVKALKEKSNPFKTWSEEEVELMIQSLPEWARPIVSFIAAVGCRPCEARNLKWKRVLFNQREIGLESLKNADVVRRIPAIDAVMDLLSQQTKGIKHPEGYVFTYEGKQVSKDHLEKTVKRVRNELGLSEGLTLYGLRHSFATRLATMDFNQEKIRKLMGHSSLKTTQRYTNFVVEDLREAARAGSSLRTK